MICNNTEGESTSKIGIGKDNALLSTKSPSGEVSPYTVGCWMRLDGVSGYGAHSTKAAASSFAFAANVPQE